MQSLLPNVIKKPGALYSGHIKKEWKDVQCTHRPTCQQFWGENSLGHYSDNHPRMKAKCTLPIGDRRPSLGRNGIQWWANVLDLKRCRLESFLFCFFLKPIFSGQVFFSCSNFLWYLSRKKNSFCHPIFIKNTFLCMEVNFFLDMFWGKPRNKK